MTDEAHPGEPIETSAEVMSICDDVEDDTPSTGDEMQEDDAGQAVVESRTTIPDCESERINDFLVEQKDKRKRQASRI